MPAEPANLSPSKQSMGTDTYAAAASHPGRSAAAKQILNLVEFPAVDAGSAVASTGLLVRDRDAEWASAARDFLCCSLGSAAVFIVSSHFPTRLPVALFARPYFAWAVLHLALVLLTSKSIGLYRCRSFATAQSDVLLSVKAVAFAGGFSTGIFLVAHPMDAPISKFLAASAVTLAGCSGWRLAELRNLRTTGELVRNVLLIGDDTSGETLRAMLQRNRQLGFSIKEWLHEDEAGDQLALQQALTENFIDEIVIALPCSRSVIRHVAAEANARKLDVTIVPDLSDFPTGYVPLDFIGAVPHVSAARQPIPDHWLLAKRSFDFCMALLALGLLSPAMLIIALAIRLSGRGPILYRSMRVGRRGRKFCFYKFRTMVPNADAIRKELLHLNERTGLMFKIKSDPRVTRVGRILRRYSLDELPQLWNVIKGDMSLVGPRPPSLDEYENYSWQHLTRLGVRPGITGLWQVTARQDPCFDAAVALDTKYIRNWSMRLDLRILLKTLPCVFRGEGR
jgi:exopolysaccharide biosynthesis polyprenyl glycosylphosphotransferase